MDATLHEVMKMLSTVSDSCSSQFRHSGHSLQSVATTTPTKLTQPSITPFVVNTTMVSQKRALMSPASVAPSEFSHAVISCGSGFVSMSACGARSIPSSIAPAPSKSERKSGEPPTATTPSAPCSSGARIVGSPRRRARAAAACHLAVAVRRQRNHALRARLLIKRACLVPLFVPCTWVHKRRMVASPSERVMVSCARLMIAARGASD